ncbi:unnamed protein product [Rotaria sp. Silwood2]|nr:unnamed protein product [Rotaria sp. Silwood2]
MKQEILHLFNLNQSLTYKIKIKSQIYIVLTSLIFHLIGKYLLQIYNILLICASNNTTPFRFDEYGGLVTVMKNSGTTNELNNNQTTINDPNNPTNSASVTNSTTDFLLPQ